jgi:hypothetical protein
MDLFSFLKFFDRGLEKKKLDKKRRSTEIVETFETMMRSGLYKNRSLFFGKNVQDDSRTTDRYADIRCSCVVRNIKFSTTNVIRTSFFIFILGNILPGIQIGIGRHGALHPPNPHRYPPSRYDNMFSCMVYSSFYGKHCAISDCTDFQHNAHTSPVTRT